MTAPLEGMRVVELSSFVAVPLGGMTLAQLGADVIRVDQIGGGPDIDRWPLAPSGRSLYWAGLNKGKRSVTVDLRSPEGRELVADLVAESGVVLTNAPQREGLTYEALRERRPDLIHVQLQGRRDGGNAVDYTVWRNTLGENVINGTGADGNRDGVVDMADYSLWKQNFGLTSSGALQLVQVPAPGTLPLAGFGSLAACFALVLSRRRQRAIGTV